MRLKNCSKETKVVNNPLNIRLDKIIEKLPSVSPEPCEDCISRQAAENIKAEIYALTDHVQVDYHTVEVTNWSGMKKKVLAIIDKHISGKENHADSD